MLGRQGKQMVTLSLHLPMPQFCSLEIGLKLVLLFEGN